MTATTPSWSRWSDRRSSRAASWSKKQREADWLHFTVALLCHDIGYLRGICPGDSEDVFVTDEQGGSVRAPRGASDAFLTPYHIERGKIFVRYRCAQIEYLDAERIARASS